MENYLSKIIVDTCFHIHVKLGPGLLESVYEEVLYYELCQQGYNVKRQYPIPIIWEDIEMKQGFRADLIVEDSVLIEIKSVSKIEPVHKKQVLTYIKLTDLKLGLLINFNEALIKDGITRVVNNL
ncbi:GxxExxY protein [Algoriphagus sp.]|uniref:GxxExxY protein n=1 Tax=Algoriphagus sp. TaxID=1872435 RepID=UPI00391AA6F7